MKIILHTISIMKGELTLANNKVKFLRGTSAEYASVVKDKDIIYFTTDDNKLYIGD